MTDQVQDAPIPPFDTTNPGVRERQHARIDLALVAFRVQHAADQPEVLDWNLPHEIVVVGVFTP